MKSTMKKDLVIIGGGPAGLAAALAAKEHGTEDILILERDHCLGGILNQCIHNGFGLHTFKEELTGPEYAARFADRVIEVQIPYKLNTMVLHVEQGADSVKRITAISEEDGLYIMEAKAVILAMGCRERPRGALNIPGFRPAGVYSAGTAQRLVNIEGLMPGKEVVILGSGDIGLIMARRMTLEGAKVKAVAELMPYSGGLKRNIVQCLDDFGIPLKLSTTVTKIHGKERVEGVTLAKVGPDRKPVPGSEEYIPCDTLLLSVGLIPENELTEGLHVKMSAVTSGPEVNESMETECPGVFACGNVLHVHDLVDFVSEEAAAAGKAAAEYVQELADAQGRLITMDAPETATDTESSCSIFVEENPVRLTPTGGVRYTVPSLIHIQRMNEEQIVRFRVGDVYKDCYLSVYFDKERVQHKKKRIMAPGEMEQIKLKKSEFKAYPDLTEITICIEEA